MSEGFADKPVATFGFPNVTATDVEETLQTGDGGDIDLDDFGGKTQSPVPPAKEYFCGIRGWHPRWLQVFRSGIFFTILLCCNCLIERALGSYGVRRREF